MITCFNRDTEGNCMAFKNGECSGECSARIPTVDGKITLLVSLLTQTQSTKCRRELEAELGKAKEVKRALMDGALKGWMGCYLEDVRRGEGGGASESDSNRKTGMKQLMKDNRSVGVKPTKESQAEYKEALTQFEENVGEKMEKLGRTSLSHSRVDSYTGVPICFVDSGLGKCRGLRQAKGTLTRDCKVCPCLKEGIE